MVVRKSYIFLLGLICCSLVSCQSGTNETTTSEPTMAPNTTTKITTTTPSASLTTVVTTTTTTQSTSTVSSTGSSSGSTTATTDLPATSSPSTSASSTSTTETSTSQVTSSTATSTTTATTSGTSTAKPTETTTTVATTQASSTTVTSTVSTTTASTTTTEKPEDKDNDPYRNARSGGIASFFVLLFVFGIFGGGYWIYRRRMARTSSPYLGGPFGPLALRPTNHDLSPPPPAPPGNFRFAMGPTNNSTYTLMNGDDMRQRSSSNTGFDPIRRDPVRQADPFDPRSIDDGSEGQFVNRTDNLVL